MLKEKIKEILEKRYANFGNDVHWVKMAENDTNQIIQAVEEDRKKKMTEEVKINFKQNRLKKNEKTENT